MKRIAWILVVALGCALALLVLLVALVPREALKTRIGEQIASWTGRDVSLRGEPEIHFFPDPQRYAERRACRRPGRAWTTRKSSRWTG